jgi:hypothetical protein
MTNESLDAACQDWINTGSIQAPTSIRQLEDAYLIKNTIEGVIRVSQQVKNIKQLHINPKNLKNKIW